MSDFGPDNDQHDDPDAPGARACTTITRLIITVDEPDTSPPIYTLLDGWLVWGGADITPIALGTLEAATRQLPVETRDDRQSRFVTIEELSGRERQVLGYLPSVLSTAEIGAELSVSANTVKLYLRSMYRKLGVSRRADAVIQARRHGLL